MHNPVGEYEPEGNAFYLKSSHLESGEHISRYSVRSVLKGYQYYKVGNEEHLLTDENYLIVNKGIKYFSEINSLTKTESVIVALNEDQIQDVYFSLTQPKDKILDSEVDKIPDIEFFSNSYPQNKILKFIFKKIKKEILNGTKDDLVFDHLYYWLIQELILNHLGLVDKLVKKSSSRKSTQLELYRRLGLARDFMDANYTQELKIDRIAQEAALSPYYFIREFKRYFGTTPLIHLNSRRLDFAKYLLRKSNMSIQEVTTSCGFEDQSSFTRLFKRNFNLTPTVYRKLEDIN